MPPQLALKPACVVYIDGFNFYYGLLRSQPEYKWLNLFRLCQLLLPGDEIRQVNYFTAMVGVGQERSAPRDRQKRYWKVLRTVPQIQIVEGLLTRRTRRCGVSSCVVRGDYDSWEEKQTDVNLSVRVLLDVLLLPDPPNRVVVISGDIDLIPPLKEIRKRAPEVKVQVFIPTLLEEKQYRSVSQYSQLGIKTEYISEKYLKQAQFPGAITVGDITLTRPKEWIR